MNKVILISISVILVVALVGFVIMFGQRTYHNLQRKKEMVNTFAIQNIKTGMDLRPYNAGVYDEAKIIQYTHHNWECMTWQFIKMEDGSFILKNLYTQKTFQPKAAPESGTGLWQKSIEANSGQYWEFIEQSDDKYLIRLKNTELYVTVSSDKKNSEIILMQLQNSDEQLWKLIEQHPIM